MVSDTSSSPEDVETPAQPALERPNWRQRLIPKTVLGLVTMLIAFSIGASLSGVVLYSYYETRLDQNESRVDSYVSGFDERFATASETLDAEAQNAQAAIQAELDPLRQIQAEGGTVASLVQRVGGSVWFVETLDEEGAPSVGTAFVVETNDSESVMVTSHSVIAAATNAPGPEITISKGEDRMTARLDNWVEEQDLAVLTVPRGDLPTLEWVSQDQLPRVGERTFIASGLGAAGGSVSQGFVSDVTNNAVQHDAAVGAAYRGGPLLNSEGRVTAIASDQFAPFNFAPTGGITYAVPVRVSCEQLLRCPEGNNEGAESAPQE